MKEANLMDFLTSADQETPDWLVKITFLGGTKTSLRVDVKSWFADTEHKWFHFGPVISLNSPYETIQLIYR